MPRASYEPVTGGLTVATNKTKRETANNNEEVLQSLIEDPTRSIRELAAKLGSYRQKIWRKKKEYEKEKVIWGYTAVIDENKLKHIIYLVLFKMKPLDRECVEIILNRLLSHEPARQNVRMINLLYVNGQYDWIMMFSAPDHATARRYYDSLRIAYDRYLLEKPIMVDINFCLVREGKIHPDARDLMNFVPV